MNKKCLVLSAIVLALPVAHVSAGVAPVAKPAAAPVAPAKVRYMDLSAVMGNCAEGKAASDRLQKVQDDLAARVTKLGKKYEEAAKAYQSQEKMLSADARNKKQQEIVRLEADYKNELQACENEFKLLVQQETEKLAKHVDEAVSKLAKAEGLDAVVDKISGRTVYVADAVDNTQRIIAEMNKAYKPAAPAAKAKA